MRDGNGVSHALPGVVLRGWNDLAGSIPPFAPDEFTIPSGRVLPAQVRLVLQTTPCYWAQPILSVNTINLSVRAR